VELCRCASHFFALCLEEGALHCALVVSAELSKLADQLGAPLASALLADVRLRLAEVRRGALRFPALRINEVGGYEGFLRWRLAVLRRVRGSLRRCAARSLVRCCGDR